jgi:hypothetical protein
MKLDGENAMDYMQGAGIQGNVHPFRNGYIKRNHHVNYRIGNLDLNRLNNGIREGKSIDGSNIYVWEVEMKIYPSTLDIRDNPETTPPAAWETLTEGRMMRFAVAYCDADLTGSREYFMGSVFIPGATANARNQAYQTADVFARMYLVK